MITYSNITTTTVTTDQTGNVWGVEVRIFFCFSSLFGGKRGTFSRRRHVIACSSARSPGTRHETTYFWQCDTNERHRGEKNYWYASFFSK
jgi:hypothetical protein